jgi:hypothetical protein
VVVAWFPCELHELPATLVLSDVAAKSSDELRAMSVLSDAGTWVPSDAAGSVGPQEPEEAGPHEPRSLRCQALVPMDPDKRRGRRGRRSGWSHHLGGSARLGARVIRRCRRRRFRRAVLLSMRPEGFRRGYTSVQCAAESEVGRRLHFGQVSPPARQARARDAFRAAQPQMRMVSRLSSRRVRDVTYACSSPRYGELPRWHRVGAATGEVVGSDHQNSACGE